MARHLVAVCVMCLLCAEHFPCKGHIEGNENNKENLIKYSKDSRAEYLAQFSHESNMNEMVLENDDVHAKHKNQREIVRLKRHAHHAHSKSNSIDSYLNIGNSSKKYIGKIFSKYGKSDQMMTLASFDELLNKLDLKKLVVENKDQRNGKISESSAEENAVSSKF